LAHEGKNEGIVFFQARGMALALIRELRWQMTPKCLPKDPASAELRSHTTRGLTTKVDAVLAEAVKAGGQLIKPAQDVFGGGYSGYFSDPDGFLWEVAWNPFFKVADDGIILVPE
jgi:predicted lactoylglutathione lyase